MKQANKFYPPVYLPKVKFCDVYDMMDAGNISRMHLGLDPLPYKWYKITMQLAKAGLMKFADNSDADVILAYCVATRKERREIPKLHDCYMAVLKILRLRFEIHKKNLILNGHK